MPRRKTSRSDNKMPLRKQARAIWGVAKLSFVTAPGAVLFKLAGSAISAIVPFVTTYFAALTTTALADAYAGSEVAGDQAIVYVLITAALGLFMTAWSSVDQYIQAKMRFVVEVKVTDQMYEHFLNLSFANYDDKKTADLYDKAQRFSRFFAYVFDRIAGLISQLITMMAGVTALLMVNVWLSLIVLVAIIPGVYIQFRLSRAQIEHWNKNVDVRRVQGRIEWNLLQPSVISELRLYGIVKHLMDLRSRMREKDERQRIEYEKQYIGKRLLADTLEAATEVGSLIWVVLQIINNSLPIGQFVFVQQVVSRAMGGASGFVSQIAGIDEDLANLFDYEEFMNLPLDNTGSIVLTKAPNLIKLHKISFAYPSRIDELVLEDIDLEIKQGQRVAIVGENGAGKSTLIKLLTGLYHPTSGQVLLDENNLKDVDIASWHKMLGVLQQDSIRYTFATARDNVKYGNINKPMNNEEIIESLKRAEAEEFVNNLPRGLDNYVDNWMGEGDDKGVELSGGQWQRLALARNFYRDAPIIILDEPTSAIDALAESKIFNRLFKESNKTIITVSHRLTTVKKADVIYMLEDGRIVESGKHQDLVGKKGRYYRMFKSQLDVDEV